MIFIQEICKFCLNQKIQDKNTMVKWLKMLVLIIALRASIFYFADLIKNPLLFFADKFHKTHNEYQIHRHQKVLFSGDSQTTTYDKKTFFEHLTKKSNRIFLINCNFYHCKHNSLMLHGSNGGAILLNAISTTIDHCKFRNNYAAQNGGAAYIQSSSIIRITDSIFSSNSADNFCGGLFLFNIFKCLISDSNFSSNTANEASSLAAIYCRNCVTKKLIFNKNQAISNGTIFIEKSTISDEGSIFLQNTANIASSVRLGGFSESNFINTEFFDEKDIYSIVSSISDISSFTKCIFSRDFKNEFLSNGGKFTENGSLTKSQPNIIFSISYLPVPTYPPLRTPNLTKLPENFDDSQSNRNDISNSPNPTQWKSLIIFLYIFFIIMLVYVLANHFSWFSRHSPRSPSYFNNGSLLRRSRSSLSMS